MWVLIGVLSVIVYTDLRYYRIPNICILLGMAAAVAGYLYTGRLELILVSLVTSGIVFICFYPFYVMGGLGAGDVKLFMLMACYIRGEGLLHYITVTMLIAALLSAVKIFLYKESRDRLIYFAGYVRKVFITGVADEYKVDKGDSRCLIRMAVPAYISLIMMCFGVYA